MNISSRTPEGAPNTCPLCGLELKIEPSRESLDAPCPACGKLLWFDSAEQTLQEVFSTGEAAKLCKVSQQTIIRCFDSGQLQGFRAQGNRFRRIPRESLILFMTEQGIPVPEF
jgi:excisionase family DNA binding protein